MIHPGRHICVWLWSVGGTPCGHCHKQMNNDCVISLIFINVSQYFGEKQISKKYTVKSDEGPKWASEQWVFNFFTFFNSEKCVQWLIGIPLGRNRMCKQACLDRSPHCDYIWSLTVWSLTLWWALLVEFFGYKHHMKHPVKARNSYLLIGKANFHTLNCFRDSSY